VKKPFKIQRTFAPQVQTSWNQSHAPLLVVESFPKTTRTWSEASQFGGSHNFKTKQNKLPSFIDRYVLLDNESFTTINNQFLISICEVRQWKIKTLIVHLSGKLGNVSKIIKRSRERWCNIYNFTIYPSQQFIPPILLVSSNLTLNITLFSRNWTWFQESWSSIVDYFITFLSLKSWSSIVDYFIAFWYYGVNSTISNRFWWYIICKRGAWHVTFIENFHHEYE